MIEINLLPEELKKREILKLELPEIPRLQVFVKGVLLFLGLQILLSVFAVYQRIEILGVRHQMTVLKEQNKELLLRKSETAAFDNRTKQIEWTTRRKFFWSSLLNTLAHSMTKGVWLREFSVTGLDLPAAGSPAPSAAGSAGESQKVRYLKLEGSAIGQGQETSYIGKFIKGLKENAFFGDLFGQIELSNINQRKIKDVDVYDFDLVCVFKKERV